MRSFTLDTNCILAVDEGRPEASYIRHLVEHHERGTASVALVAISASEKQRPLRSITNFEQFIERVTKLGLGNLDILDPMAYWDVSFWDHGLRSDESMLALERKIHEMLFPKVEFDWPAFCAARGIDVNSPHLDDKWRNAKCDVQAFWSHAYRKRDVFVTSDSNFHAKTKKPRLLELRSGAIETPERALNVVQAGT
jgi:hypothetical protein